MYYIYFFRKRRYKKFFDRNKYDIFLYYWECCLSSIPMDFIILDNKEYLIIGSRKMYVMPVFVRLNIFHIYLPKKKIISLRLEKLGILSRQVKHGIDKLQQAIESDSIFIPCNTINEDLIEYVPIEDKLINHNIVYIQIQIVKKGE